MNQIKKIYSLLFACALLLVSCSPDKYLLGDIDVLPNELVEGIAFKIEHDAANPNIVYLTSLMDNKYTPIWEHPQGRSQNKRVELRMPFPGTYTVKFGVQTRGGTVYGEPVTFQVDQMYAEFISDEMWTKLAGGAGEEKTWYLDLDANGLSRHFVGPMYFYGTGDWWGTVNGTGEPLNSDSWNWLADWKGNPWIMDAGDYGSMTFNLKGGANVIVNHKMLNRNQTGTYLIDTENKTMRMVDASPLHGSPQDGIVLDWGNIRIMSLTENTMQLGVFRDPALSGESAALLVFNFISKDFYDNWVPGNQPDPEPPYNGNANDDLTTSTSTKKTWGLSLKTPYNWTNLGGEFLNMWSKPEDYTATGWAPYVANTISKVSLTLDKTGATNGAYTFTDGTGAEISGTYSTDNQNNIVFDKNISFSISDWVALGTTADNKLRMIRTEVDALGNIIGLWLGKRDPEKNEYMVYKFEPKAAGGATDPLAAWKNALAGKTFKPDVNYFADWVSTSWTGGWTAESNIYPDKDFNSQNWFWTADVYNASLASSIRYYLDGTTLKADAVDNGLVKNGIVVNIDAENGALTYSVAPFTYSWIFTNNGEGKGPWLYGSYDGANLGNINTKGIYLGFASGATEITMTHFLIKP